MPRPINRQRSAAAAPGHHSLALACVNGCQPRICQSGGAQIELLVKAQRDNVGMIRADERDMGDFAEIGSPLLDGTR